MKSFSFLIAIAIAGVALLTGCSTPPQSRADAYKMAQYHDATQMHNLGGGGAAR